MQMVACIINIIVIGGMQALIRLRHSFVHNCGDEPPTAWCALLSTGQVLCAALWHAFTHQTVSAHNHSVMGNSEHACLPTCFFCDMGCREE